MTVAQHPDLTEADQHRPEIDALATAYRYIADCFVNPDHLEVDREQFIRETKENAVPKIAAHIDERAAAHLEVFLDKYEQIDTEEYVRTLELSPECPLYLGHYEFDQPETCREIADADRNQYMVELQGIYEHFGFELEGELPDFVPAMVEFLWLTVTERDQELRTEFMSKMKTMLPSMIEKFQTEETPYRHPLEALERIVTKDIKLSNGGEI